MTSNNETLYTLKPSIFKKAFYFCTHIFYFFISIFLLASNFQLINLIGLIFIIFTMLRLIDIVLFKEVRINKNTISKEWYLLGMIEININTLALSITSYYSYQTVYFLNKELSIMDKLVSSFMTGLLNKDSYKLYETKFIKRFYHKGDL